MESETKPNKAHHEKGQKESLDPAKIAPTYLRYELTFDLDDYGKKGGITTEISGGCKPFAIFAR